MPKRLILALIAAIAPFLAGCMTGYNIVPYMPTESSQQVYGGVKLDVEHIRESLAKDCPDNQNHPLWRLGTAALATVDLPFSALGDTLTLPITIYATNHRCAPGGPNHPELATTPPTWISANQAKPTKEPEQPTGVSLENNNRDNRSDLTPSRVEGEIQ
jgi:uncharacterized protein YceK